MSETQNSGSAQERLALLMLRSPTRRQIIALLLEGKSRKAIAREMKRSHHTIDAHLKAIYREIGVGDRALLMLIASELIAGQDVSRPPPRIQGVALGNPSPHSTVRLLVRVHESIQAAASPPPSDFSTWTMTEAAACLSCPSYWRKTS